MSELAYVAAETIPVWRGPAIALLALLVMGLVAYFVAREDET